MSNKQEHNNNCNIQCYNYGRFGQQIRECRSLGIPKLAQVPRTIGHSIRETGENVRNNHPNARSQVWAPDTTQVVITVVVGKETIVSVFVEGQSHSFLIDTGSDLALARPSISGNIIDASQLRAKGITGNSLQIAGTQYVELLGEQQEQAESLANSELGSGSVNGKLYNEVRMIQHTILPPKLETVIDVTLHIAGGKSTWSPSLVEDAGVTCEVGGHVEKTTDSVAQELFVDSRKPHRALVKSVSTVTKIVNITNEMLDVPKGATYI
ncbi:hypothetical protein PR048_011743, partial [Dryococelus australis]